jgi:UDP-galactopyranose mutase
MKILIIGAGLSGCTIARLLKDKKHDVSIIEKENHIGGLCITRINEDGLKYEPFGAKTFHTKNPGIKTFITQFDDFNGYIHRKGMIINNKLFPFPLTKNAINNFEERDKIFQELENRPKEIDKTNFETACISIFGRILYSYFIENYTSKMWGINPKNLTVEWAPKRLELREDENDELFRDQWQGLPKRGYSFLLKNMIKDIPVMLNTTTFNPDDYDIIVSSAPIDEIFNFKIF